MAALRELRNALGLRRGRPSKHVQVGRHTYGVEEHTVFLASDANPVVIGSFCSIAKDVCIHGDTGHDMSGVSTYPLGQVFGGVRATGLVKGKAARIGHDVWIGAGATILSGVEVGDGAVIGAGSVVSRDVEPYAVMAGNPARLIRYRFEPSIIAALVRIGWWNWTDERIKAELDSFGLPVDEFVKRHG